MSDESEIVFKITTDHELIKSWIVKHGGKPVSLSGKETPGVNEGVISVEFDHIGHAHKTHVISWEEFFKRFDQSHLAFEYTDGEMSEMNRFYKFINWDGE